MGFIVIVPPTDPTDPNTGPEAAYVRVVTDSYTTADSMEEILYLMSVLSDSVNAVDSTNILLTISVLLNDGMTVDDTQQLDAQYFRSLLEQVEVLSFIKTPAELAQGWVLNTEGNMPISEYSNFTFNSMAYSPDEMLGCTDEGLYTLDGDTDAGTNIDAHITSLMLDFDTSKLKRMSAAYIGYTSTGKLLLKVRSIDQDAYAERWYEARDVASQATPGQNRMQIGKGLRSRYWTFELVNIEGSDFELDKVELYPIVLQRRI